MNRYHSLAFAGLAVFAIAACKRDAEAPPAAAEPAAAAVEAAPVETPNAVISEVDHNSPASAAP